METTTNASHVRSTTTPKNIKLFKVNSKSAPPKQLSANLYSNKNNSEDARRNEENRNDPVIQRVEYEDESRDRVFSEFLDPAHVTSNIEMIDTTVRYEVNQTDAPIETTKPKERGPPINIKFFKFGKLSVKNEKKMKNIEAYRSVEKVDASVNTDNVASKKVSNVETQTNAAELFLNSFDMEKFVDYLQSSMYHILEASEIDELVEDHFNKSKSKTEGVLDRSIQDRGKIIPDSPPATKSSVGSISRQHTSNTSEHGSFNSSIALNNSISESFRHCLFKKELINGQKKNRPSLDFLSMNTSRVNSNETIYSPRSTGASKYSDSNSARTDSLIIEDTPSKNSTADDSTANRSELDVTLSKSMTRGECVNAAKIILENSMRLDNTLLLNKSADRVSSRDDKENDTSKSKLRLSLNPKLMSNLSENQPVGSDSSFIIPDTLKVLPEDTYTKAKSDKSLMIADTMPMIENEKSNIQQLIITDTVQIDTVEEEMTRTNSTISNQDQQMAATLVFAEEDKIKVYNTSHDTSKNSVVSAKAPLKRVVPKQTNYHDSSGLLDSFADSSMMHAPSGFYSTNTTFSDRGARSVVPPAANDILGVSLNHDLSNVSMMNSSISTTNRSVIRTTTTTTNRLASLEMLPPPPLFNQDSASTTTSSTNSSKSKYQPSADSLTDSNMMKIDDICREMYSDQNQTINEENFMSHVEIRTVNSAAMSTLVKKPDNKKLEMACSLLKPDMKVRSCILILN